MAKINIFLASSNELKAEREQFEIQIGRKNKEWRDRDMFLNLDIWEDLSARMSSTGSQSEYNKKVEASDLFVLLAFTKVGMYTSEEFEKAFGQFQATQKPFIFTYFKKADHAVDKSLLLFKEKLSDLGHFYSPFVDSNDLWIQFNKELERLQANEFVKNEHPAFNELLIRTLIEHGQKYRPEIQEFVRGISKDYKSTWEKESTYVKPARRHLLESYLWVISCQLRRLFNIGSRADSTEKIDDYIQQSLNTFKMTLQIVNFALLSHLWDEGKGGDKLDLGEDKDHIAVIFENKRELRPDEYIDALQGLIRVYRNNQISLPFQEMKNLDQYFDEKGEFLAACECLFGIRTIFDQKRHKKLHCFQAEENLAKILSVFAFLITYELVSMKKIELEWQRNRKKRYVKDFTFLSNLVREDDAHEESKKYDSIPANTCSMFLLNDDKGISINLFPFVLDHNALIHEHGNKICLLEHRNDRSGLEYYAVICENNEIIQYQGVLKNEDGNLWLAEDQQIDLKLDMVIEQFMDASITILGRCEPFQPVVKQITKRRNI